MVVALAQFIFFSFPNKKTGPIHMDRAGLLFS